MGYVPTLWDQKIAMEIDSTSGVDDQMSDHFSSTQLFWLRRIATQNTRDQSKMFPWKMSLLLILITAVAVVNSQFNCELYNNYLH